MAWDLSNPEERRRLVVEVLRSDIITSVPELRAALREVAGQEPPRDMVLRRDLEAVGVVRVNLGGGRWRYRTADLITNDDVKVSLQDRLNSDGISALPTSDGLVIRTTKGTAGSVAGMLKMLMDYQLDDSILWVLTDNDDHILVGIAPREARQSYLATFRSWMGHPQFESR
jgi:arginine repressor